MRIILSVFILTFVTSALSAQTKPLSELTVEEIMQSQSKFVGTSPSRISWSRDSKDIFFVWNQDGSSVSSTYKISKDGGTALKDDNRTEGWPNSYDFNSDESEIVFVKNGDIFIKNILEDSERQLTSTTARESNAMFHKDNVVSFVVESNLFTINTQTGLITQLSNFDFPEESNSNSNNRNSNNSRGNSEQDRWLKDDQLVTSSYLKRQSERPRNRRNRNNSGASLKRIKVDNARGLELSPDGRFVSFSIFKQAENPAKRTIVPNYVTSSGYTTDIPARPKVGGDQSYREIGIFDTKKNEYYVIDVSKLPGIQDKPDYLADYPDREVEDKNRVVSANRIIWSEDGKYCVVHFGAHDNKDRWIMRLLPDSGDLITLDRQRDEAWIAGPGIGSEYGSGTLGILPDNKTLYYQSEKTGYSHLFLHDLSNGRKTQLTKGNYEVYSPRLSNDGKTWYFTANMKHPGIRHFYSMPVMGGKINQITTEDGNNEVTLSPDEKTLAIRYSYMDQPWDLFVQENKTGAAMTRLTDSQKEGFKQYDWHKPEVVTFGASDGANVHARLYKPENPNGAAVVFVHGAGYLQNVHYWWSSYQREYMFNNMLMAKGYTVLDIDYRASAGYGRDWRTGIYRHMGGKDLSDQIDGVKYLVEEHGVDPNRVGMYGGSYGGFITLFAMFQHPDVIAAGAALRSVTDWAHYNHGYTSNILNTPVEDPIAFKRSSPIYFAEGLQGDLLIAHGMIDTNVHFQDVVRLAQKLIELGKDNWEMAVYPVENHGFQTPSGWTDEYKRIFKLFENTIGKE